MFCGKCGKSIPDGLQSCPFCHAETGRAPAPPPPEATAAMPPQPGMTAPIQPQPPPPVAPPSVYQQPVAPPPQYAVPAPAPQASGSSVLIPVLVAALLLVLAVGGIGTYVVVKRLAAKPPVETPAGQPVIQEGPGAPSTETPGGGTRVEPPTPGSGGAAQAGAGLDALVGQWRVELAQLDGPPPETLTMVRKGSSVVGTLNDRINTHLDLQVSGGDMDYEGTWTDPQVGTAPVSAVLMPEGTLEVFILDGSGGADLLISASRRGARPPASVGGGGSAVGSAAQAEGLVANLPDVREWQANVQAASQPDARRTAHVEVDSEETDKYLVHVYEMVEDPYGGHTATFGWYYVYKADGRIEDATADW